MTDNALFLLPALRRARDLIDREYAEPLDLDAMAREAGYSRFHFARAFTAAYGETPRSYLTRRRIERASAPMLDFAGDGKAAFPSADGAAIRSDIPGGYAGIAIWKGKLVFDIGIPPSANDKDQLIALAKLVLVRAAGLT